MRRDRRYRVFVDLALVVFCMLFPHAGLLPIYLYPLAVLLVLFSYLRYYGETFADVDFRFRDLSLNAFITGSAAGLFYACFAWWVLAPLLLRAGLPPPNLVPFAYLHHNLGGLIALLLIASLIAIPYEEIIFRGYILSRLKGYLAKSGHPFLLSGLLCSVLFALYHYQEGWGAVTGIFVFSIATICLLKRYNGNLWYVIFFHIAYDVFMLTSIYIG